MIIVRVIFVDTTLPVKIRPRMETLPVKGHFLSVVNNRSLRSTFYQNMVMNAPIYMSLIASDGVLNPRPTSLYHLFSFVEIFLPAYRTLYENIHITF